MILRNITLIIGMAQLEFIFINGRGSSGKDTQADLLVEADLMAVRISTGDIFRGASKPDGEYGRFFPMVGPYVDSVNAGGFLPDEVMLPIVAEVIKEHTAVGKERFIFTGFPRTSGQLIKLREWLASIKGETSLTAHFVCLAVSEERSMTLARERRTRALSEGKLVRRDDLEETLAVRLAQYRDKVEPMLTSLIEDTEFPLIIVKGNRTIEEVHRDLEGRLNRMGKKKEVVR